MKNLLNSCTLICTIGYHVTANWRADTCPTKVKPILKVTASTNNAPPPPELSASRVKALRVSHTSHRPKKAAAAEGDNVITLHIFVPVCIVHTSANALTRYTLNDLTSLSTAHKLALKSRARVNMGCWTWKKSNLHEKETPRRQWPLGARATTTTAKRKRQSNHFGSCWGASTGHSPAKKYTDQGSVKFVDFDY